MLFDGSLNKPLKKTVLHLLNHTLPIQHPTAWVGGFKRSRLRLDKLREPPQAQYVFGLTCCFITQITVCLAPETPTVLSSPPRMKISSFKLVSLNSVYHDKLSFKRVSGVAVF